MIYKIDDEVVSRDDFCIELRNAIELHVNDEYNDFVDYISDDILGDVEKNIIEERFNDEMEYFDREATESEFSGIKFSSEEE